VANAIAGFEEQTRDTLSEWDVEVLPIPSPDHESVVRRDLERRKPFNKEGKGYRDYLIWLSVLEVLKRGYRVVFVTTNKDDFCDDQGCPHGDLLKDLDANGIDRGQLVIAPSLDKAVSEHVESLLSAERLARLPEVLASREHETLDVHWWIEHQAVKAAEALDLRARDLNLPDDAQEVSLGALDDAHNVEVSDVRRLPSGELWITGAGEADASLDFLMTAEYYSYFEHEDTLPRNHGQLELDRALHARAGPAASPD
jgi:hypothetical protein